MSARPIHQLTSGPIEGTFDAAVAAIQNYGFPQSLFEVERLDAPADGSSESGQIVVLRPGTRADSYSLLKPGDKVHCTGLRPAVGGKPALCKIRRMADGVGRHNMTEFKK